MTREQQIDQAVRCALRIVFGARPGPSRLTDWRNTLARDSALRLYGRLRDRTQLRFDDDRFVRVVRAGFRAMLRQAA